jgi:acyl dehydratase
MPDTPSNQAPVALPELNYDELEIGRSFRPLEFEITPELVRRYVEIVGDANSLYTDPEQARSRGLRACVAPPGLWGVWGRQAYLQDHAMPAGGVLAGEELVFVKPAYVGDTLTVQAEVADRFMRKDQPRVIIEITARGADGDVCGIVRITAVWPR